MPKLLSSMRITNPRWPIPMDVSLSLGNSWGEIFPFRFDKEGKLEPQFDVLGEG